MKIIKDINLSLDYINSLRENTYSNIKTSGNDYFEKQYSVEEYVKKIIELTKSKGDDFLFELSSKVDGKKFDNLQISSKELKKSIDKISKEERILIENTIDRIEAFQKKTLIKNWFDDKSGYGEYVKPVDSVGCYIPGGTAPLISTVLMTVIPAKVAGVKNISISSPTIGSNLPNNMLLAASYLCGVEKFYTYGGPQAIASLAFGTKNVSKVDMICGPGNIFVMTAKKLVYGEVGLDGIFGGSKSVNKVEFLKLENISLSFDTFSFISPVKSDKLPEVFIIVSFISCCLSTKLFIKLYLFSTNSFNCFFSFSFNFLLFSILSSISFNLILKLSLYFFIVLLL